MSPRLPARRARGFSLVEVLLASVVLALGLYVARRVVDSPFGLAVRGIHENRARMAALGTPVIPRLLAMYTLAGALAGVQTPLVRGFLAIASAICGQNFLETGRTLASLGFGAYDRAKLQALLQEGFR